MLVDEGKLGWDDPVRKHLPDFHLTDPLADAGVTLRDLFCHRTGLSNNDFLWYRAPVAAGGDRPTDLPDAAGKTISHCVPIPERDVHGRRVCGGEGGRRSVGDAGQGTDVRTAGHENGAVRHATAGASAGPGDALSGRTATASCEPIPWYVQTEPNPAGSVHVSARDLAAWLRFQIGDGTFGGRRLVSAAASLKPTCRRLSLRRTTRSGPATRKRCR